MVEDEEPTATGAAEVRKVNQHLSAPLLSKPHFSKTDFTGVSKYSCLLLHSFESVSWEPSKWSEADLETLSCNSHSLEIAPALPKSFLIPAVWEVTPAAGEAAMPAYGTGRDLGNREVEGL